jgi:hypothetical protein
MSQVRLYLDEDSMRRSLVFALRARNLDVLTAAEAKMINREDDDHLAAASALGRTLFTHNTADYCVLDQQWIQRKRTHSGIVVAPQQRYSVGEEMRRIMRLISQRTAPRDAMPVGVHFQLGLGQRVDRLEAEIADLKRQFIEFKFE